MNAPIADQAEKLRQLAENEKKETPIAGDAVETSTAVLDAPESPEMTIAEPPAGLDGPKETVAVETPLQPEVPAKEANSAAKIESAESGKPDSETGETPKDDPAEAKPVQTADAKAKPPSTDGQEKPNGKIKKSKKAKTEAATKVEVIPNVENQTTKPVEAAKADEPREEKKPIDINLALKRFPIEGQTKVIAITGGKGGVGKTNIAANVAICFARMNKQVMLMDADLSLANVDVLLGMTPRANISHVISGEKKLWEVLIAGPHGILILPGGSGVEELAHLPADRMAHLFEAFSRLTPTPDILLLDTAAGIHPNVMQFLMAADQVLVVTTPEPTAYVDAYALIKTIVKHDPGKEIGVIVNMAKDRNEAMEVQRLLGELCLKMLKIEFTNLGFVPRDNELLKAVRHQQPVILKSPQCPSAQAILNLSATLLQVDTKKKNRQGLSGFFRRLFSRRRPDTKAASM